MLHSDLLCGLGNERILMESVCDVTVKGSGLHGDSVHAAKCPVGDVKRFQHPEAC